MRALALGLTLLAGPLVAQLPSAPAPAGAGSPLLNPTPDATLSRHRPLAMINGIPITLAEVTGHSQFLRRVFPGAPPEELLAKSRRILAEEILFAAEAERLGVVLGDEQMDAYWQQRFGRVPDFAAIAKRTGTSAERQRDVALRAAMAELYLLHRVGIQRDLAHIVPVDPIMARALNVTPKQLREHYRREKPFLTLPETVEFTAWLGDDRNHADRIGASLRVGATPQGGEHVAHLMPVSTLSELLPERLATWLVTAAAGAVSEPVPVTPDARGPWMLVHLSERRPPREPSFAEVQQDLRNAIRAEFLEQARQMLVAELVGDTVFWPEDLFEVSLTPRGGTGGR